MKSLCFLYVFLAACLTSTIAFGAGRSLPDTAKIVPPQTLALVNIQDVNSLQKQFQKTNMYKLYKDPAMGPFFNGFKAKWQKSLRESQDEMTKMIADVNALPSGRLAVALVANENTKATGEPAFLLISQWAKDVKTVKTAIDKAVKKSVENGARQEKDTIRGHEIVTITQKETPSSKKSDSRLKPSSATKKPSPQKFVGTSDQENAGQSGVSRKDADEEGNTSTSPAESADTISYCFLDDALIAAEDKETLKFVISRIDGGTGQSLADNENYQSAMRAVGPVHDIDIYVNIERVIKIIVAQDSEGKMGEQMIANLGLDNVASLGAAISVGRVSGSPEVVKGLLKINGQKKGIMKVVEPQSSALQVPRFIDSSSVSLSVSNISIKNAYDELVKMMTSISPDFRAAIDEPLVAGDENGKGSIRLKQDILDYIGSQITVASSIKKPFSSGFDAAKSITAIAINDRAAIEKSLATLHSTVLAPDKPDSKRELLGHTIYITDMSSLPFIMPRERKPLADVARKSQTEPEMPKLAFTVTDTHLILGSEENVAQAIRLLSNKDASSLTTAPWFVRAKSALPGSVGIAGLSDGRTYGEYLWWNLKEKGKRKPGGSAFDPTQIAISGLAKFLDFNLLPDFEVVKKYFGVSANYLVSRPDGYYFELQQLDMKAE